MTPEQWFEVINTNLNSLFNMTRPVIEGMRERGFGRIVNISSINGQKGQLECFGNPWLGGWPGMIMRTVRRKPLDCAGRRRGSYRKSGRRR
jgi:NAD(P)-dependent dehydrogenase (short-subunit alcohol dehydrogenase family)